jgi:hypothetical protein
MEVNKVNWEVALKGGERSEEARKTKGRIILTIWV